MEDLKELLLENLQVESVYFNENGDYQLFPAFGYNKEVKVSDLDSQPKKERKSNKS
jgi:hypothetical protein